MLQSMKSDVNFDEMTTNSVLNGVQTNGDVVAAANGRVDDGVVKMEEETHQDDAMDVGDENQTLAQIAASSSVNLSDESKLIDDYCALSDAGDASPNLHTMDDPVIAKSDTPVEPPAKRRTVVNGRSYDTIENGGVSQEDIDENESREPGVSFPTRPYVKRKKNVGRPASKKVKRAADVHAECKPMAVVCEHLHASSITLAQSQNVDALPPPPPVGLVFNDIDVPRLPTDKDEVGRGKDVKVQALSCEELGAATRKLSVCIECADSRTGGDCRFIKFRKVGPVVRRSGAIAAHKNLATYGFVTSEKSASIAGAHTMGDRSTTPWTVEQALYVMQFTYPVLQQVVIYERRLLHLWATLQDCSHNGRLLSVTDWPVELWPIRRPIDGDERVREMCDICDTSIFNLYLICKSCCSQICPMCVVERSYCPNTNVVPTADAGGVRANTAFRRRRGTCGIDAYGWPFCTRVMTLHDVHLQRKVEHRMDGDMLRTMQLAHILPHDPKTMSTPIQQLLDCQKMALDVLRRYNCRPVANAEWMNLDATGGDNATTLHKYIKPWDRVKKKRLEKDQDIARKKREAREAKKGVGKVEPGVECNETQRASPTDGQQPGTSTQVQPPPSKGTIVTQANGTRLAHDGRTLMLDTRWIEENAAEALAVFQAQWRKSSPVIVSGIECDESLWSAATLGTAIKAEHGGTMVNCVSGSTSTDPAMFFREHFGKKEGARENSVEEEEEDNENAEGGVHAARERTTHYKISDYPTKTTFREALPEQYNDACKALPFKMYTTPTNHYTDPQCVNPYNLASLLPPHILFPDLGPKMYSANSMLGAEQFVTTPLHNDISDAVNIMTNVSPPQGWTEEEYKERLRSHLISENIVADELERVMANPSEAGAIWIIWPADEAPNIRRFVEKWLPENIQKVMKKGEISETVLATLYTADYRKDDAIHDQTCFLNGAVRRLMAKEMGIKCNEFVQMKRDAVFIPSGAPHQVQNVSDCVKAALDFVSAEGCAYATQNTRELRRLPDSHVNHSDKLQLSNIVYYAQQLALSHVFKAQQGD